MVNNQKPRHLQGCSSSLLLLLLLQMVMMVRCDYPPPSEDGQGYYSRRHQGRAVVGTSSSSLAGDGYLTDWNSRDWAVLGNPNPGKCVVIPSNMTLCHGIGYEQMRIPNLLEHETLKEATSQAQTWVRLLGLRCHPDTQVFLCSLFAPVCLDRPIWPCRSLCEAVQAGCEDRMLKYGFPWPEMLRCDKYPSEDDLCIGLRNGNSPEKDTTCSACQADTFESTVDHYCQSDFAMRIKVKQSIVTGPDMKIDTEKKKKMFKTGSLSSSDLRDSSLYIVNGSSCDCGALDNAKNGSSFIVMGNMANDRPVLSFIHRIDKKKSKDVNRALRVAHKRDLCTKTDVIGAKSLSTEKKVKGGGGKAKARAGQPGKGNRKATTTSSESNQATVKSKLLAAATTPAPTKRANRDKKDRKKNSPATPPLFY